MAVHATTGIVTFLLSDIEGSTRLWEDEPERMPEALAQHDALARAAVAAHRGTIVKMAGDGVHAAFDDPLDAIAATLDFQRALADPAATNGIRFGVRCGLHAGVAEGRDNDYFGSTVNRAARIMGAAHGGQVLVSQAVAELVHDRLPAGATLRDLGSVRLRSVAHPEHIHQLVHPELRHDFPALRSLEATPNNLPQQFTSFVGRERERGEALRLLSGPRLLTLTGPGGIGKTRLSLQVAADVMDAYPDGTWFVDLAPVMDPALVPQTVARVLGVQELKDTPLLQTLCAHFAPRRALLVLDNCEHLVAACAALLGALLQTAPGARFLATSREPLNIVGEQTYPLRPLSLPDPGAGTAAIARSEAIRLFIERARLQRPDFRLTDRLAPSVVRICTRLDGIPLALELAAARIGTLPVGKIAERLDDRFRLLSGGAVTGLPRQQTLRAMVDWSFDLLSDAEKALFARLSVFAGGFTLEAAESVCATDAIGRGDVLEWLASLVQKSLVTFDAEADRYRMLETIGEYARARLEESGEAAMIRRRHRDAYAAMASEAEPTLAGGAQQAHWLSRLEEEHDNLRAALSFSLAEPEGTETALAMCGALYLFWVHRGHHREGYRWCKAAIARNSEGAATASGAKALLGAGTLATYVGDQAAAQVALEQALAMSRTMRDRTLEARALNNLATAAFNRRNFAEAQALLEDAVIVNRELGNQLHEIINLVNLGNAANSLGHFAQAAAPLERALDLSRAMGMRVLESDVLGHLAMQAQYRGDYVTAQAQGEEALAIDREMGVRSHEAQKLLRLAEIGFVRGDAAAARARLVEALTLNRDLGSVAGFADTLDLAAKIAVAEGRHRQGAIFAGVADLLRARSGNAVLPVDQPSHDACRSRCREALGTAECEAAFATARATATDDAVAEALRFLGAGESASIAPDARGAGE